MIKNNKTAVRLCLLENMSKGNLYRYEVINKLSSPLDINGNILYLQSKRLNQSSRVKSILEDYALYLKKC